MLARRLFLISCSWMVAGFALAKNNYQRTSLIVSPAPRIVTNEAPAVVLHIEGWGMPPDAERSASSHVWISINRSWQAAWR